MTFHEIEFPAPLRHYIESHGGRCVQCLQAFDGATMVSVIVADEPSRDDGSLERHVSVAAIDNETRRGPTKSEFRKALKAAGISYTNEIDKTKYATHAYTDIPKE